jgi:phosphate starvation-inducible protein PhoH
MAKRSSRRQRNADVQLEVISNNQKAIQEGPKKKRWSSHDLRRIKPLTATQEDMFQAWFEGDHLCAHGYAGTGKTFLALYLGLYELLERKDQQRIIIIRSAVPTRDLGFTPGTLEEKAALYELPYHDICHELLGRHSTYQDMKDARLIEFMTTSYIRGITWDNAIIIVDEFQNMTWAEINTIMTRVGKNSRLLLCGDVLQNDLNAKRNDKSGGERLLETIEKINTFANLQFKQDDIVRSAFVRDWIIASSD